MGENKQRVIVVGSGFGGAVAACRLSQAGFEVVILERGRRYTANDFPPLPDADALLPDFARWLWNGDRGLWDIEDVGELMSVQSAGFGGGSLIYANVHLRPPQTVFDERWPKAYRGGTALDPYYDLAGYMLDASPLTKPTAKADRLKQFASDEGYTFFNPPLTITHEKKSHLGIERPDCKMCARCSTGCPFEAKNTLDWNYLAIAERRGARVLTQCEVRDLRRVGSGWEVEYFDHILQADAKLSAPTVFLCAGTLNSTRLLAKINAREETGPKIPHVGIGYHPNADAIAMVYDTNVELDPAAGPTIGGSLVHWTAQQGEAKDKLKPSSEFFLVQDGGYSAELDRLLGMFRASLWLNRNRSARTGKEAPANTNLPVNGQTGMAEPRAESLLSPLDAARMVVLAAWSGRVRGTTLQLLQGKFGPQLDALVRATVDDALGAEMRPAIAKVRRLLANRVVGPTKHIASIAFDRIALWGERRLHLGFHQAIGYVAGASKRRWMLLTMGRDATPGVLHYDPSSGRLNADLDLYHLLPMYQRQESLLAQLSASVEGELRTNPAWNFLGKPYTVHGQGGCRMSDPDDDAGPTDPNGAVRNAEGLYVLDGSLLCTSVGVNPSATITAIAERNVLQFIQAKRPNWLRSEDEGAREYTDHVAGAAEWAAKAREQKWKVRPPRADSPPLAERKLGVKFKEGLRGQIAAPVALAKAEAFAGDLRERSAANDALEARKHFRQLASRHEATFIDLDLEIGIPNLARFIEDQNHEADVTGTIHATLPGRTRTPYAIARGRMQIFIPRYKRYALEDERERDAQERATGHVYLSESLSRKATPADRVRLMVYELWFHSDDSPELWQLTGVKRLRQDPGLDLWEDTSSLYVTVRGPSSEFAPATELPLTAAGVVHIGPLGFIQNQRELTVTGDDVDWFRKVWAITTFNQFFYGQLQQIYAPHVANTVKSLFGARSAHGY